MTRHGRSGGRSLAFRQALRFDGLWWREFGRLGCVYGPDWWKRYSPPVIAAIIFVLVSRNRRGAISNLRRVLGPQGWWRDRREALRMFVQFAHCFTETHEAYGARPAPVELIPPEEDHLGAALAEGRGAVVVTAHFGNSDIASRGLSRYGRPVSVVMARETNLTVATHHAKTTHEPEGVRVVYDSASTFRSLDLLRALRNNEVVAVQFDTHLLAPGATAVDFLGRPAGFHLGPFLLARAARTAVIPVFVVRTGRRRYAIRLCERHDPRTPQDALRAMRDVVRDLEQLVRQHPHQWFQFTPYWDHAPQRPGARATRRARILGHEDAAPSSKSSAA
jgi:KDO2-lipid IV(A) lauroyltransferase